MLREGKTQSNKEENLAQRNSKKRNKTMELPIHLKDLVAVVNRRHKTEDKGDTHYAIHSKRH